MGINMVDATLIALFDGMLCSGRRELLSVAGPALPQHLQAAPAQLRGGAVMLLFSQQFVGVCLRIAVVAMLAIMVAFPALTTHSP
jgi:hypothetical protein